MCLRFGLSELQLLCEQYNPVEDPGEQDWDAFPADEPAAETQQSLADTRFLELLRSMWEHEGKDDEDAGKAKRGTEGEDEEGSGDAEIKEDIVDEDELNEIYEFAATQRMTGTGAEVSTDSGDEEDGEDEKANNCSEEERGEGKQNAKTEEVTDSTDVDLKSESNKNVRQSKGPDASMDRSYNRMFSESWGEYLEQSQTQTQNLNRQNTPTSRRISSVSEVIDLSVSPPLESGEPVGSLFPVTGMSPGEVPGETSDQSEAVQQDLTPESPNAHASLQPPAERSKLWSKDPLNSALSKTQHTVTSSPCTKPKLCPPAPNRSQPELIVLSDSSDDMDHDLPDDVPPRAEAPRPPTSSPSRLSLRYTPIKAKETTRIGLSSKRSNKTPNSVHPEPSRFEQVGNESVLDGSGEVSWLIPATPEPSTRTNSTQTSSSMRRTQLFPGSCSSSSSSFTFSISDNPKTALLLKKPTREPFQPSPTFQRLTSYPRLSKTSHSNSVNRTYSNPAPEPCSSTPLHSDPRLQRLDPLASPLQSDSEPKTLRRAGEEDGLGSLHLSPSENSSSPRQSSRSEKESSRSPAQPQLCDDLGGTGDQELSTEDKDAEDTRTSKSNESNEVIEEGFTFVFDEPPIAFDDSWGLCGAVTEQGPCFSLKLESSGDQTSPVEPSGPGGIASPHTFSSSGHGARHNLPDPEAPHEHSLPDAAIWDSWKEDEEDKNEVDALPLSQRVGAVALAKRVSQLRTPGNKI